MAFLSKHNIRTIEDFSKICNIQKVNKKQNEILSLDFTYATSPNTAMVSNALKGWPNASQHIKGPPSSMNIMTPVYNTKILTLNKTIDIEEIKKDFLRLSIEICQKIDKNERKKFALKDNNIKINQAFHTIAMNSRRGYPTNMIMSENSYFEYNINEMNLNIDIYFDFNLNDIIMYRKNNINEGGLILIYDDYEYCLDYVGDAVKDYMILEKNKRLLKLKRIL